MRKVERKIEWSGVEFLRRRSSMGVLECFDELTEGNFW